MMSIMPKPMSDEQVAFIVTLDELEMKMLTAMLDHLGVPPGATIPYEIADVCIEVLTDRRKEKAYERAMKGI